jgi:alkanesulfonate monooxygenase SsuD/methylene tetrahydromethanopterin reductase-like flavin-dependent oxidoreductase (luciferase family)
MYGNDPAKAELMYVEGLELIMRGLTQKSLNFHGQFYSFDDVPIELEPLQKPHPPVWYGVHSIVSAERAARQRLNIVSLDPADKTRTFTDRFRHVWRNTEDGEITEPLIGLGRFIVVAASDEKAIDIARRAYPKWHRSFNYLFNLRGGKGPVHQRPADLETLIKIGQGIAGSPETVTEFLKAQMIESGANYLVGQFAFGDLSLSEILSSLELFTRDVMPELRATH